MAFVQTFSRPEADANGNECHQTVHWIQHAVWFLPAIMAKAQ